MLGGGACFAERITANVAVQPAQVRVVTWPSGAAADSGVEMMETVVTLV